MMMSSGDETAAWRTSVLAKHLSNLQVASCASTPLYPSSCLAYDPPESNSGPKSIHTHHWIEAHLHLLCSLAFVN